MTTRNVLGISAGIVVLGLVACGKAAAPPAPTATAPESDLVRLAPAALVRNEIQVVEVGKRALQEFAEAPAELQLAPDRVAHLTPLIAGQVRRVDVAVGDRVAVGQRLAVLRSVELGQARAELQRATAMAELAQTQLEREEILRREGISSERSFLEAQARQRETRAELDAARAKMQVFGQRGGAGPDLVLTAPIAGTVTERHATPGENVATDHNLLVIADTSKVWVVGHVYEKDMGRVRPGTAARLELQSQPGRVWEGTIGYVAPVVDEKTRTLEVRMELQNEDGGLRPGLFGRVRIALGHSQPAVAVPEAAVQALREAQVVFVPGKDPNSFRARKVQLGQRDGALVEIRSGLATGERVVVAGAFLLKSQLLSGEFGEADEP